MDYNTTINQRWRRRRREHIEISLSKVIFRTMNHESHKMPGDQTPYRTHAHRWQLMLRLENFVAILLFKRILEKLLFI